MTSYELRAELFQALGCDTRTKMDVVDLIIFEGALESDPEVRRMEPKFTTYDKEFPAWVKVDYLSLVRAMTNEQRAAVRERLAKRNVI